MLGNNASCIPHFDPDLEFDLPSPPLTGAPGPTQHQFRVQPDIAHSNPNQLICSHSRFLTPTSFLLTRQIRPLPKPPKHAPKVQPQPSALPTAQIRPQPKIRPPRLLSHLEYSVQPPAPALPTRPLSCGPHAFRPRPDWNSVQAPCRWHSNGL